MYLQNQVAEKILVMTDQEQIEGTVVYGGSLRMSDMFNGEAFRASPFLKITNPTVRSRISGEPVACGSFLMVAKEKIVYISAD